MKEEKDTKQPRVRDKKVAKDAFKSNTKASTGGGWVFFIWVFTFLTAALLTLAMSNFMSGANVIIASAILIGIIMINIFSDIIGTAITAAEVTPFNSMAARKVYGAKTAIMLIKNADKVSNLCNDVVGDICGIISGAACTYIIIMIGALVGQGEGGSLYMEALLGGFVGALTVGGKSLGKKVAINNSNSVIYKVAVVLSVFKKKQSR